MGEVGPIANWIAAPETERTPMVSFGTSSDRIFSPEGMQSYYVTVAKGFPEAKLAPYISVSYSEWEQRLLFPFGVNIALAPEWDLLPMHDGRNTHLLLTYKQANYNITGMLVKMRHPGISIGFGF